MDGRLLALVAVVVLSGLGYAAWSWLWRRLRHCEDRLDECREREQRVREEIARTEAPGWGEDWT